MYQISPTETRVLVDVPVELGADPDALHKYLLETVQPQVSALSPHLCVPGSPPSACLNAAFLAALRQMPETVRAAFTAAVHSSEPIVMPNRACHAAPPKLPGAILLVRRSSFLLKPPPPPFACPLAPVHRDLPQFCCGPACVCCQGDAWNTRHPLTGSGMSVCLRDVELLTRALSGVQLTNQQVCEMRLVRNRLEPSVLVERRY